MAGTDATPAEKIARGIYLVGFSGSGKSTIARALGERLQWPASDLDDLIVERSGISIPEIFQLEGEPGFRLREAQALREASSQGQFILATGGGTIIRTENREYMATRGWIICLEAKPETLLRRIQEQIRESDPKAVRPLLSAADPLEQIVALKQARQAAYGLADWTVHTDLLTQEQVAAEVMRAAARLEGAGALRRV